ncbi:MAG: hypothetical protein OEV42_12880 [Deltaproteobacteria bacterium]|nr:hypothetical protein [Deltaproteobacteria bacterium]
MKKEVLKKIYQRNCKNNFRLLIGTLAFCIFICETALPAFSLTPVVTSVTPDRGFNNSSTAVTIRGENFEAGARVSLLYGDGGYYSFGSYTGIAVGSVHLSGSYAYSISNGTSYTDELVVFDVNDPSSPRWFSSYSTSEYAWDVYVSGNYAYVTDYYSGLQIIDVSNPGKPAWLSSLNEPGLAYGIHVSGNYAYMGRLNGFQVVDVSNPSNPVSVSPCCAGQTINVHTSGRYAYAADGDLQIIDVSNPEEPVLIQTYFTPSFGWDVYVSGNYAYVADGEAGLLIIDVTDPVNPVQSGFYNTPGWAFGVHISGNYAYVADSKSGLQIIDVSNPARPFLFASYDTPGSANDVDVSGSYIYLSDRSGGLRIFPLNDPVTSVQVSNSTTITATFPASLPEGPYHILITNPAGEEGRLNNGFNAVGLSTVIADIKANASDGPLVLNSGDPLSLTVSLDPVAAAGYDVDWWVYAISPGMGTYWYQIGSGWAPSVTPVPAYQGPLAAITDRNVLNSSTLPADDYTFYFEVDKRNGVKEGTVSDRVNVTIQ